MKVDFGYPFGVAEVKNPDCVRVLPAACDAEDHFSHPYCTPAWEDLVRRLGGEVLVGPVLTWAGWRVLVEFPSAAHAAGLTTRNP